MTGGVSLAKGSSDAPGETRSFPDGRLELVDLGGAVVGRFVLGSGWRWSRRVRPTAGTDTCRQPHLGYVLAGRMHVVMDDGVSGEAGPGDVFRIDPGHDAWTVGDETVVLLDFAGAGGYATEQGFGIRETSRCWSATVSDLTRSLEVVAVVCGDRS